MPCKGQGHRDTQPCTLPCFREERSQCGFRPPDSLGGFLGMYICECYDRQAGMNLSHCLDTALHPISPLYRRKQIRRPRVIPAGSPSSELRSWASSCSHLCPLHSPDHLPQVFIWLYQSHPLTQNLPSPLLITEIFFHFSSL